MTSQVAAVLDVQDKPNRSLLDSLIAFLQPRLTLLILDNCEHLLDSCCELAEALLHACPNLTILASSREPLGVDGEGIFRVPSLPFPDAHHPTDLEKLGGIRCGLPRHQTLRAKIDWSYNLKNEKERLLFKHLSVFAGGCTLGAVETVCSGDGLELVEILELLSSLVSKSMINAQRQPGKETRYHFLETTRQYASDKLVDAGESEKLRTRHRDFYLALVETNQPVWVTREQILWIQRLQPELENLRRALEWSFSDAGDGRILPG